MLAAVGMLVLAGGCAAPSTLAERSANADTLAASRGWLPVTLEAGGFSLRAYVPVQRPSRAEFLTVYIEGDGLAWLGPTQPSADPTPVDPIGLRLALAQPEGLVAYLARPCQFTGAQRGACTQAIWTERRFAPEVVAATNTALDQLEQMLGSRHLVLVGYSGGAAIAALSAARRDDVAALLTVAGNLDPAAWVNLHRLSPLAGSLNPAMETHLLGKLSQYHYAGARDSVVPPALVQGYAARYPKARRPVVDVVPQATHGCCWVRQWSVLWRRAMLMTSGG